MPDHIQYQDDDLFNPETHHEESDVPIKPLFWAVATFIAFAFVTHFALAWLFGRFASTERKKMDPPATQVALPRDAYVPRNQPLLQPFPHVDAKGKQTAPVQDTPVTDLGEMRATENRELHSYGWVDQQHGVVRIPIEVAKQLAVQRGFPGTPASPPAGQAPSPAPSTTTGAHP